MQHEPESTFKEGWQTNDWQADPNVFVRYMDSARPPQKDDLTGYARVFELLQVQEGDAVLDVGCGTGGALRATASLVGSGGRVVGVDVSETMIAVTRQRGTVGTVPVEYHVASALALPFAAHTFNRCFAYGVFEIIASPERVVAEMVRVLCPGGQLVIRAPDTMLLDGSNRALTRRIMDYIDDAECNGWGGRQLYGLVVEQGLTNIRVLSEFKIITNFPGFYDTWLGPCLARAQAAGIVSLDQARVWLEDLARRGREGRFFVASTLFWGVVHKP
jgi:SAM-dependent methyltransferase